MTGPLKSMRLVIRDEKGTINAYAAVLGSRKGELLLGSMRTSLAEMDPALFDQFKTLMIDALRVVIRKTTGGAVLAFYETTPDDVEGGA